MKDPDAPDMTYKEKYDTATFPEEAYTATTFNRSLASSVEELYQNINLSLFSRSGLRADTAQVADVTIERWLNTYNYRMQNLLASYATALVLSLCACTLGCAAIYQSGCSHSNKFSTILRTTAGRLGDLDALLMEQDRSGMDSLPRCLAHAPFTIGCSTPVQ